MFMSNSFPGDWEHGQDRSKRAIAAQVQGLERIMKQVFAETGQTTPQPKLR
jgi:hypothetical protein